MLGGELPTTPTLEQTIIDAFDQNPTTVIAAMKRVAQAHQHGTIRSGWAVLRAELDRAKTKAPTSNVCPDCETGAGLHIDGCPRAEVYVAPIAFVPDELTECLGTERFTHKPCPVCTSSPASFLSVSGQ